MVDIYSDSAYVVNAIEKGWIDNWQNNGWKTAKKDEVLNKDLWQKLIELIKKHPSTFIKVKGHADNELNNLCDRMAVEEVNKIKQNG